jgi:hypothetical protein
VSAQAFFSAALRPIPLADEIRIRDSGSQLRGVPRLRAGFVSIPLVSLVAALRSGWQRFF